MERKQGVMDMALFTKIADECAALGITHVRMHNYGEASSIGSWSRRCATRSRSASPKVGLISNGSLITEEAARGMVDAGLDAINISVDAAGKEVFETTRVGLKYDKVVANIERLLRIRAEAGKRRPKLILSFVRQNNSNEEQAFIEHWGAKADKIHITDLHNWAGTLNHESDVNFPCYRPWLTFTVLWDGRVSLCCADFDGRDDSRRPADPDDQGHLERRALPQGPPRSPRPRRTRHLPVLRPPEEGLSALDHETLVGSWPLSLES